MFKELCGEFVRHHSGPLLQEEALSGEYFCMETENVFLFFWIVFLFHQDPLSRYNEKKKFVFLL